MNTKTWKEKVEELWAEWLAREDGITDVDAKRALVADEDITGLLKRGDFIIPAPVMALLGRYTVKNHFKDQMPEGSDPDRDDHADNGWHRMAVVAYWLGYTDGDAGTTFEELPHDRPI